MILDDNIKVKNFKENIFMRYLLTENEMKKCSEINNFFCYIFLSQSLLSTHSVIRFSSLQIPLMFPGKNVAKKTHYKN
jgi:hypothetical protein